MTINEFAPIVYSYIDPGTGSALFTILVGLIGVIFYGFKGLLIKIKSGIKKEKVNDISIPYVIYTDSKRYWSTFKAICDEFESKKIKLKYFTQSKDDPVFNQNYKYVEPEFIGDGNKAFAKLNFLKADVLLSTTPGLDVYQWKRSKDVKYYIHVYHSLNDATRYRMFGIDYYDAILLASEYQVEQIRQLENLRGIPKKELKIVGVPYLDELLKRINNEIKTQNNKTTVLLAPSWGPSSLLNIYGSRLIDKLLDTGYEIVIRPHPQSYVSENELIDSLKKKYPNIVWNNDNDNFDILNKADIMISDFSGVMFDFSLVFDKPIIYANVEYDNSIYDAWWLEDELWTFKVLPFLGQELKEDNFDNLKCIIDDCLKNDEYKKYREKIRKESWKCIGESSKLTAEFMISKGQTI